MNIQPKKKEFLFSFFLLRGLVKMNIRCAELTGRRLMRCNEILFEFRGSSIIFHLCENFIIVLFIEYLFKIKNLSKNY